jgi:hypothetical protein
MPSELSITVKNEEKRQTTNHLIYDTYAINEEDPIVKELIDQAVTQFNASVDSIRIKISMEVK